MDEHYLQLKKHYLDYIVYYQAIEEFFCCYIQENTNISNIKNVKSFNRLSKIFLEISEKNETYHKDTLKVISYLIGAINRDYMIHEFTNDCLESNKKSNWIYELMANEAKAKRFSNLAKELLNKLTKAKMKSVFKMKIRHFERSNYSSSFSKDKLDGEVYNDSKQLRTILDDNYFHLVSLYNTINKNLFVVIKDINRKYKIFDDSDLDGFKNRAIGVMYELLISKKGSDGVLIQDTINNLGPVKNTIADIYRDRNYWIHYFTIDFYNKHHKLLPNCSTSEELLECINSIRSSIVFANRFNVALANLKM